jgi:hypothetical protein
MAECVQVACVCEVHIPETRALTPVLSVYAGLVGGVRGFSLNCACFSGLFACVEESSGDDGLNGRSQGG